MPRPVGCVSPLDDRGRAACLFERAHGYLSERCRTWLLPAFVKSARRGRALGLLMVQPSPRAFREASRPAPQRRAIWPCQSASACCIVRHHSVAETPMGSTSIESIRHLTLAPLDMPDVQIE